MNGYFVVKEWLNMKKKIKRILGVVLGCMMVASVAFAQISRDEACNVVYRNFPGATITEVEHEWDDGIEVYEIHFIYGHYDDAECTIDANTGNMLEYDLD